MPGEQAEPFPFAIGKVYYNAQTHSLFVGAGTTPGDDYRTMSVSWADPTGTSFTGITPEKVILNDVANQTDPLYGATINQLSFTKKMPLIVTNEQQNVLYAMFGYGSGSNTKIYQSDPVLDANDAVSQGIIALDGKTADAAFSYVALPSIGNFGDSGSLVGICSLVSIPDPLDTKKTKLVFRTQLSGRVEKSSDALKIGSDLVSMGNTVALHHAESFEPYADEELIASSFVHIYTGISGIGGALGTDGIRGVMLNMGTAITPNTALESNSIVGGIGANTEVHINCIEVLYTSTQLHYLVVAGGVGTVEDTSRTVYALPLHWSGALAKKNAIPITKYTEFDRFWFRYFNDIAINQGDLFSPNEISDIHKARVGGDKSLPGPIKTMFTSKDTVFVTIDTDNVPEFGGIFCSQALFDAIGRIQGWTNWHRVNGFTTPTPSAAVDNMTGNVWSAIRDSHNVLNTIIRSKWDSAGTFVTAVHDLFSDQEPGIQGLMDFPYQHPSFNQTTTDQISIIVATGYNRISLIQSGGYNTATGFLSPTMALEHPHKNTTGGIGVFPANTDSITISGGMLSNMGGIVTADIVSDSTYSWLVVGGNGGVAILARPDGSGWTSGSLGTYFSGLPTDAAFKIIGNFINVRKIVADGANLYILTETECRRFVVSQANIAAATAGTQIGTLLASSSSLNAIFGLNATLSDMVISAPVGLIGTSRGLVRVGNGHSVAIDDYSTLNWQLISLPESVGPISRFYVISQTGMQNEWATKPSGGNLYVLNSAVGSAQARVYRFAVTGSTTSITDETVVLFADHFIKSVNPSFYVSRGDYRNNLAYDGNIFYFMRSHFHPYPPQDGHALVEALSPTLRTGIPFVEQNARRVVSSNSTAMGPLVLRSAQGCMITGGSNMYTNE